MTDRYDALTIVLDRDIREDDAEWIINAIKMVKGVQSVEPHVSDITSVIAAQRAKREIRDRLWAALEDT